jgi:hypothetical protein
MHGLAQTTPTPEKRALYLKMASTWHQMAQRWEKKVESGGTVARDQARPIAANRAVAFQLIKEQSLLR